jgi:hypothetical protein
VTTVVDQVESWYQRNAQNFATRGVDTTIHSLSGPVGTVEIRAEPVVLIASMALWNQGYVTVIAIRKDSQNELTLDDRTLKADEYIPALLDGYFHRIVEQNRLTANDC